MSTPGPIVYVGAVLPKRSETFVYREVLGLRDAGVDVVAASVRAPESELGEDRLDALAQQAVVVYRGGFVWRGLLGALRSPGTVLRGLVDALTAGDLTFSQRGKLLIQCLGGLALAGELRGKRPRHLHAHMAHVPTAIAMYAARALGVPFSFTGHAADLFRDRSALTIKLRRSAFVACISRWHRDFYKQLVPRPDRDYPVIRCGVDVDQFSPDLNSKQRAGLLTVGRLVRKKGFDLLIDAMASVECKAQLTIVGDGPERHALRQQIDRLGLGDRVKLVGAKLNHEVQALMQRAEAFVLPCRVAEDGDRDGIPVVLMEAMASGMAVISGDLPTIRELVEHERTGLMVEPGDVDVLAAAIERLAGDDALAERLAVAGRAHVVEEFSLPVNLGRLRAAFDQGKSTDTLVAGGKKVSDTFFKEKAVEG